MSSIIIYQSLNDLKDKHLEELVTECQTIMSRGREATIDMCINLAKQEEYLNTLPKKVKNSKVSMIIDTLDIQKGTFYKYANAGRHYLANPDQRHLSMDDVLKKPKQITAQVAQKPPKIDYKAKCEEYKQAYKDLYVKFEEFRQQYKKLKTENKELSDYIENMTRGE